MVDAQKEILAGAYNKIFVEYSLPHEICSNV